MLVVVEGGVVARVEDPPIPGTPRMGCVVSTDEERARACALGLGWSKRKRGFSSFAFFVIPQKKRDKVVYATKKPKKQNVTRGRLTVTRWRYVHFAYCKRSTLLS